MPEERRTEFAMAAMSLAELFQISFGQERLVVGANARAQGAPPAEEMTYRLEISAPEGPSTGGGKQAVQHLKMVPTEGPTMVLGSVNQVEKTAELRTFEYLAHVHAQRFKGAKIPLQQDKYNDLLTRMQSFFVNLGFRLVAGPAPPVEVTSNTTAVAPAPAGGQMTLIVVAVVVVLGGILAALALRGSGG